MEHTIAQEKRHNHYEEHLGPVKTHIENDEAVQLSEEHREYLLKRHGTLDLDPMPDMSDADPFNW